MLGLRRDRALDKRYGAPRAGCSQVRAWGRQVQGRWAGGPRRSPAAPGAHRRVGPVRRRGNCPSPAGACVAAS
eukprot:8588283-Pyramimonas_sp.AAC.1